MNRPSLSKSPLTKPKLLKPTLSKPSLALWMQTLITYVRSGRPDLTNRQLAVMMLVYLTPGPHTVRGIAKGLNVSKPVVTRALNRLGSLGYLQRQRDQADRRNVFVVPTDEGTEFLDEFGRLIADNQRYEEPRSAAA